MAKDKETSTRAEDVQKERQARIERLIKTLEAGADKDDDKFRRVEKLDKERLKLAKKEEKFEDLGKKLWQSTMGGMFGGMGKAIPEPIKIMGRMVGVMFGARARIKKKKQRLLKKAYKRAADLGMDTSTYAEKSPEALEDIVENLSTLKDIEMPEAPTKAYKPIDWLLGKGPQGGGLGKEDKTIEKKGAESFVLTHDVKLYELMEKWYGLWERNQLTPAQKRELEIEGRKKKSGLPVTAAKTGKKDGWFANLFGVGGIKGLMGRLLPMIGLGGLLGGGMLAGLGAIALPAAIITWGLISAVNVYKDWKKGMEEGGIIGAIAKALGNKAEGGWMSALGGAATWGGIGAAAGFAATLGNPIGALIGALIGVAFGGLFGWIGGNKIEAALNKIMETFDLDDAMTPAQKQAAEKKMADAKARIAEIGKPGGEMDQLNAMILRYEEMKGQGIKLTDEQTANYEKALKSKQVLNTELIKMHDEVADLKLKLDKQEYKEAQDKRQELESQLKDIVGGKLVWSWAAMDWIRMYGSLKDTRIKIEKLKADLVAAQEKGDTDNITFITNRIAALEESLIHQANEAEKLAKELEEARDKEYLALQEQYRQGNTNFIQNTKYEWQTAMRSIESAWAAATTFGSDALEAIKSIPDIDWGAIADGLKGQIAQILSKIPGIRFVPGMSAFIAANDPVGGAKIKLQEAQAAKGESVARKQEIQQEIVGLQGRMDLRTQAQPQMSDMLTKQTQGYRDELAMHQEAIKNDDDRYGFSNVKSRANRVEELKGKISYNETQLQQISSGATDPQTARDLETIAALEAEGVLLDKTIATDTQKVAEATQVLKDVKIGTKSSLGVTLVDMAGKPLDLLGYLRNVENLLKGLLIMELSGGKRGSTSPISAGLGGSGAQTRRPGGPLGSSVSTSGLKTSWSGKREGEGALTSLVVGDEHLAQEDYKGRTGSKRDDSAQVAAAYAPQFQSFVQDLLATGYKINYFGGFRTSNVSGTDKASWHQSGMAIDINKDANKMYKKSDGVVSEKTSGAKWFPGLGWIKSDMPTNIQEIASKHGLGWGGAWRGNTVDPMHFSIAKGEGGVVSKNDVIRGMVPVLAAAQGLVGFVKKPTLILAGEKGPESVNIRPSTISQQASGLKPNPATAGGTTIINAPDNSQMVSTSTNNQLNQDPGWAVYHTPVYARGGYGR